MRFFVVRRRRQLLVIASTTTLRWTCVRTTLWSMMADIHPCSQGLRVRCICAHVPGIVLQNRAAHASEHTFIRQIARKPQPPIEFRVVQFS